MLPQIGSTELLVIAAIALIVVGPKDLPVLLRKLGKFVGRLRGMATDFRSSFDEMARQSELDELRKEVAAMRDAASAETAAVENQLAGGFEDFSQPPAHTPDPDYDPESYLQYPESTAEKVLNRRKKVAETETAPKKAAPRKTAAKAPAKAAAKPKTPAKGKA